MSNSNSTKFNRRGILKSSMAMLAGGVLSSRIAEAEPAIKNVNLNSSPSTLKITDMRYTTVVKLGPSPCTIIRIDTNQGVPDAPGLGITLNDEEMKKHIKPGVGYFEPTPMWDEKQSWDDAIFS